MKPFTSSTKPLLSFCETDGLKKLVAAAGDRLTGLSKTEKYQLSTVLSLILWTVAEDLESVVIEVPENWQPLSFEAIAANLKVSGNVKLCLLYLTDESPDTLAAILPVINEYAREDDRLIASLED